jgi:hypothetical protein
MQIKTKADLVEFIRNARDSEKKTYREIYLDLKKMGYKSKRTGQILSEVSVRNMVPLTEKHERAKNAQGEMVSVLSLIERVLDTQGIPAQAKIDLINGIRKKPKA